MGAVFLKLLHMSLAASGLVIAVMLLRLLLKRAPKAIHCALWALVALRLLLPVSVESSFSLIPEDVASGNIVSEWTNDYIGDVDIHHPNSVYYDAAIGAGREPISDGEGGYYVVTKHDQLGEPATVENTVIPILGWVWLTGCAVMLLYAAVSFLRIRKRVQLSLPLRDNIRHCEAVDSPFILGFFRPKIYLPFDMDEGQMQHVIAHEEAHLRRRDHWWKPLGFLLLAVYWFNPLLWVAYILLCRDIELACDERVIRDMDASAKKAYSEALLSCSLPRRMVAACPLAFGEVGVKTRIASVLHYKKPAFWVLLVAILACIVVAVCFMTNPKDNKDVSVIGGADEPTDIVLTSTAEAIWSRVDTSSPTEMMAYLCQADLWNDAIKAQRETSMVGNFDTTVWFSETPKDGEALDIAMARRACLLMRLYPDEVFYVMWTYPDENGSIARREFHADEMGAIIALSSHTEVIAQPDSAKSVGMQLGFLGALDEKLFIKWAAAGNSLSPLYEAQKVAVWFTPEDIHDIEYMEWVRPDGQRLHIGLGEGYEYVESCLSQAAKWSSASCSFGENVLYLHRADGIVGKIFPADDTCWMFLSDGAYYRIGDWEDPSYEHDKEKFFSYFKAESSSSSVVTSVITPDAAGRLLDVIVSSPLKASSLAAYMGEHPEEVETLLMNPEPTLEYILTQFLNGNQTDLKGSLMRLVLDELAPEAQLRLYAETGQEYFDEWMKGADRMASDHGLEWLEEHQPALYLALQIRSEIYGHSSPVDMVKLPKAFALDTVTNRAACDAILASLRTGWWTGNTLNPAEEAAAFTCFLRLDADGVIKLYGYGGYFSRDAEGNDADEWSNFTIVTLDADTLEMVNVWWPGDGAYHDLSITENFPDDLGFAALNASPQELQTLHKQLKKQADGNMKPVGLQPIA